ncbi:MAG: thioredoxin domain-containing protein [Bacteroidetes bacterium]|jgi:protein-disulfide isomerase/uncharacterized membrane protein|nr:thioredoxin domain-containing protein [Bacteroidota bacterium]
MEKAVADYLSTLDIPISERYCKKRIASHPDYPSILAVSDTLHQLGIKHTVARADMKQPNQIPLPALLHLEAGGGSLLPVYESGELNALADKLKSWSGVLLKAEPTNTVADKENSLAFKEERRFKGVSITLITAAVGLIAVIMSQVFSWTLLLLATTAVAGLLTGYLLFAKDLGITYRAVESFCNAGTGAGCGKVLRSDEGNLFGFITFSDVTLGYFAAQLAAIGLIAPLWAGSGLFSCLSLISILALPVIGYSIWLQAVRIKEWCRLCLVVSGILTVQAIIFGYLFYLGVLNPLVVAFPEIITTLLFFGVSGTSVLLVKQTIQQKNRAVQNEMKAVRLKNSPEVFTSLLFRERQVDTALFENDFLIGSPDAPVKLTMAVNLFCGPCKNELEQAKELLSIYPGQVSLSLRLLRSGDKGVSSGLLLKTWLHGVKERSNRMPDVQELIEAWYEAMDTDQFSDVYPVNGALSTAEADVYAKAHYDWINQAGIVKTPTTFMNGYELPSSYRVKDLVPLIPGLTDVFGKKRGINKVNGDSDSGRKSVKQKNV